MFFNEGEIWWGSLGSNIGSEEEGKNFSVMLSQIRLLDAKRLQRKVRKLSKVECVELKARFVDLLR